MNYMPILVLLPCFEVLEPYILRSGRTPQDFAALFFLLQ
uniref:Uncharacterized protein n=1 Tax=Arundo donax TaxID=35708 RepID=A0A0A9GNX4_ARUDO